METKRKLRTRIENLMAENNRLRAALNFKEQVLDKDPLPPLRSTACAACEYAVFWHNEWGMCAIGCGKGRVCENFKGTASKDPACLVTKEATIARQLRDLKFSASDDALQNSQTGQETEYTPETAPGVFFFRLITLAFAFSGFLLALISLRLK